MLRIYLVVLVALGVGCAGDNSLSGLVWQDSNANELIDEGEPWLPDVRVFIDDNNNRRWDEGERYAFTDEEGQWQFQEELDSQSTYSVVRELPFGWSHTATRLEGEPANQIIGGTLAGPKEFPFAANLIETNGNHRCGASLIAGNYALTAAHCIGRRSFAVSTNRASLEDNGTVGQLTAVIIHPDYERLRNPNDIALIRLDRRIMVPRVYLATEQWVSKGVEKAGTMATVMGWGTTENAGGSTDLLKADVPLVSQSNCRDAYGFGPISDDMICAGRLGQGGVDSCQGDSGGPLIVREDGKDVQVGIVSWGNGCADPNYPGVYARVSYFESFLQDLVEPELAPALSMEPGDVAEFGHFH